VAHVHTDVDATYPGLPDRLQPSGRALVLAAGEAARTRAAAARRMLTAVLEGGVAYAAAAGVRIAAGTDAGNNYTPHGWSLHHELHLLRQAGLAAAAVLAAATHVAAGKLGGPETVLGRITDGGPADLLASPPTPGSPPRRSPDRTWSSPPAMSVRRTTTASRRERLPDGPVGVRAQGQRGTASRVVPC
jgi:hypothetical protein